MNRPLFGALGVAAVLSLTVGSCKNDPLSDLDNGAPAALVIDFTHLTLPVGDTVALTASVLDGRATPLVIPVSFAPCNAIVTTPLDTSYHPVPATSSRALVSASTWAPSCVVVTGGGFVDTVTVSAVPARFPGALSSTTPLGGDTLIITSTSDLKFNPATAAVTFGGDFPATILSATADAIVLLVPFSDAGPLAIKGVLVMTYSPPLELASLRTAATVVQTGDLWTGDTAFATAPTIPIPASGDTLIMITTYSGSSNVAECAEAAGPCVIYRFTLAAPTTLTFVADWDSDADLDIYACDAPDPGSCFEEGGGGATGDHPQEFTFTFPAGTHYFVVENFDVVPTKNIKVTISQP